MQDNSEVVREILDSLPEKSWRIIGWDTRENWYPVKVDVADRKRLVEEILRAMEQ